MDQVTCFLFDSGPVSGTRDSDLTFGDGCGTPVTGVVMVVTVEATGPTEGWYDTFLRNPGP